MPALVPNLFPESFKITKFDLLAYRKKTYKKLT